jgi:hypothetical protein
MKMNWTMEREANKTLIFGIEIEFSEVDSGNGESPSDVAVGMLQR